MPWVSKEICVGCGICVGQCPSGAMSMKGGKAEIDMDKCIRCGKCHDFCPRNAVRHDSERIPQEVEDNMKKARELMKNFKTKEEREAFLGRMKKHFNKEKTVAERSIKELENLKEG